MEGKGTEEKKKMRHLRKDDLATLYGVYCVARKEQGVRGDETTEITRDVVRSLRDGAWTAGTPPSTGKKESVRRWFSRWDANNGRYEDENRVVIANKARTKVTSPVKAGIRAKLLEPRTSTHDAAKAEYRNRRGECFTTNNFHCAPQALPGESGAQNQPAGSHNAPQAHTFLVRAAQVVVG